MNTAPFDCQSGLSPHSFPARRSHIGTHLIALTTQICQPSIPIRRFAEMPVRCTGVSKTFILSFFWYATEQMTSGTSKCAISHDRNDGIFFCSPRVLAGRASLHFDKDGSPVEPVLQQTRFTLQRMIYSSYGFRRHQSETAKPCTRQVTQFFEGVEVWQIVTLETQWLCQISYIYKPWCDHHRIVCCQIL